MGAISLRGDGATLDVTTAYGGGAISPGRTLRRDELTAGEVDTRYGRLLTALPAASHSFTVQFVAGRADQLTPESDAALKRLQDAIKAWPDVPDVDVIGHTDTAGSLRGKDALSLKRAATIRSLLIKLGVPAEQVHVAGRGERQLLVPTADNMAEAANRRVEITVY